MHFLASLLPFALSTAATSIMLPLYIYPNVTVTWNSVVSAVAKYPNVNWQIIINPATGPGVNTLQDQYFGPAIRNLTSYPNVQAIGYVESYHATRNYNEAVADINTYVSWNKSGVQLHGIFFDDVSGWYDFNNYPSTYSVNYTWYSNISNYVYQQFPASANPQVVFNTGDPANATFYDISDTVVEYEDYYTNYTSNTIPNIKSKQNQLNWGSFIFHNTPKLTQSAINNLINSWDSQGLEYVYFTSDQTYQSINSTLLNALAYACANY